MLDSVLKDWSELEPAGVLVAGDLVNGRWGFDEGNTGNFGPVDTLPDKRAALRRAARTYYPQWQQRFDLAIPTDRGVTVPGPYLLFAIDDRGTPSKATWVRIPA